MCLEVNMALELNNSFTGIGYRSPLPSRFAAAAGAPAFYAPESQYSLAALSYVQVRRMEPVKKKKRVTFKKKHENQPIKVLLRDLYSRVVGKDHKTALKIEQAMTSLSKYPLPLSSGEDCYILKGFDQNLCRYVNEKLFITEPVISDETSPVPDNYIVISSGNKEDKEIQTDNTIEEKKITGPYSLDSDDDLCRLDVYRAKHNSLQDSVLTALYIQQMEYPTRPALNKKELALKAAQHTTIPITHWDFVKVLEKKNYVLSQVNEHGVEEFLLTRVGMAAGKVVWDNRHNILNNRTAQNFLNHKHDGYCRTLGCSVYRVVPPQTARSHLQDKLVFIDMPPGSYEVILVVDKNEPESLAAPTKFHKAEIRSLKVGDILWVARSKINGDELVLPYIVERKRIDDFAASIKDGRFHEQKFRLRKCGLRHVIYLLEDHPGKKYCGLPKATLEQAKINTRIQDGFLIHETDSLKGTKRFLDMMTSGLVQKLEGKHLRGTNSENPGKELMLFDHFNASSSKTKPLTVKETFIKMLLQLKGLSVEKALAITNEFNSPQALMTAYNNLEGKEQDLLLAKLRYNNYLPKVGPTISKTLSMFFNYSSFDISSNNED